MQIAGISESLPPAQLWDAAASWLCSAKSQGIGMLVTQLAVAGKLWISVIVCAEYMRRIKHTVTGNQSLI